MYLTLRTAYEKLVKDNAKIEDRTSKRFRQFSDLATSIVPDIIGMMDKNFDNYLDIGCGDFSITSLIATIFSVKNTYGVDIIMQKNIPDNINFRLLPRNVNFKLPFAKNKFDVVSCMMSLHHIQNVESCIKEIYNVLVDNGMFIIREHDCISIQMALMLDVMHGFYSMVYSHETDSLRDYYARYYTSDMLCNLICSYGFALIYKTDPIGPFRWYHAIFIKV